MSSKNLALPEAADQGAASEAQGVLGTHGQDGDMLGLRGEDYSRDAAWADYSWQ
jgi:hypothetical protein